MKKEMVDIVDGNGVPTGIIVSKDEAHDKNLLHNEVSIFIMNSKKQVLLQLRDKNKRFYPNKWALCAGHVEAGETLKIAMKRELEEEVGVKVNEDEIIYFQKHLYNDNENSNVTHFYYTEINKEAKDFIIQKEELSEVKWFNINEIIEIINSKNNSTVFGKKTIERLKKLNQLI